MMGGGWGIFMMLFMLLFWGAIVIGIVLLIRYLIHSPSGRAASDDALDILKRRYARGEIEKAEFEEKKKDLGG
jgi:putative membrane protein